MDNPYAFRADSAASSLPPAGTSGSRMDACRLVKVVCWLRWKAAHPVAQPRASRADQALRAKVERPTGRTT